MLLRSARYVRRGTLAFFLKKTERNSGSFQDAGISDPAASSSEIVLLQNGLNKYFSFLVEVRVSLERSA